MLHEKFRTIFRFAGIFLLSTLLPACRPDLGLDAEFKSRLDALRSGTVRHWKSGGEIDYLSAQILKERNPDRRNVLFAACSNTVVNVPIVATNNLTREKYPVQGTFKGPIGTAQVATGNLYMARSRESEVRTRLTTLCGRRLSIATGTVAITLMLVGNWR